MEPAMRFELMTSSLPRRRSTPELRGQIGAGDETRTRDPQLGRLMLYQLSYTRPTLSRMKDEGGRMNVPATVLFFILHPSYFILASGAGGRIRTYVGQ